MEPATPFAFTATVGVIAAKFAPCASRRSVLVDVVKYAFSLLPSLDFAFYFSWVLKEHSPS